MNKILLIISREYFTRVRKKSFLIMTFLTPILMTGVLIAVLYLIHSSDESYKIEVVDEAGLEFVNTEKMIFEEVPVSFPEAKATFAKEDYYAILYIPKNIFEGEANIELFAAKDVSLAVKERISSMIEKQLYTAKLSARGIQQSVLDSMKTDVNIRTMKTTEAGEEQSSTEMSTVLGYLGALLIYLFIFLYGVQVMRGVMEEKTSRIVEVILSSVKPFQLMMGKIVGVALVGLTQFLLWVVLSAAMLTASTSFFPGSPADKNEIGAMIPQAGPGMMSPAGSAMSSSLNNESATQEIMALIGKIDFVYLISVFIFYFLGGYLLYSALFAAIGAAVDHESDTQQFMLPITLPLIVSFLVAQVVVTTNPDSAVAFWFSIIPLTSPIVMMVRIPFGVPAWQLGLSMAMLVLGFLFTTWLASRIYRTGILMYGKKVTYKELSKWLFYKG